MSSCEANNDRKCKNVMFRLICMQLYAAAPLLCDIMSYACIHVMINNNNNNNLFKVQYYTKKYLGVQLGLPSVSFKYFYNFLPPCVKFNLLKLSLIIYVVYIYQSLFSSLINNAVSPLIRGPFNKFSYYYFLFSASPIHP